MENKDYFLNRKTVRKYSSRHVEDELLRSMLEKASHAPTTGNMQLYSVVVTRSQEMKKTLSPMHFDQPSVTGCDVLLTFCADYNRFVRWCEVSDAVPGTENFQSFITAVLDTMILAQQFCTVAEMEGLGCCYLGTTAYNADRIAAALELPRFVVPVATLTLGYPQGESPKSDRLETDAFMHQERYRNYSDDDIRRIYKYKEELEESKGYVEENHKKTLAQVYTDVRYKKEDAEAFSKVLCDLLEKQGFKFPR